MTTTINASPTNGLVQTADGSGVLKVQSNGVTTNALAWVRFTGSTGGILSSYNVSSITRASAGTYTMNLTTALSDANYAILTTAVYTSGSNPVHGLSCSEYTTVTTTAVGLRYFNYDTLADPSTFSVAIFGN